LENKSYFFKMLENVREKISSLPEDSYIKKALIDNILDNIECKIDHLTFNELKHEYYPPLFLFMYRNDLSIINELDRDILFVKENSSSNSFKDLTTFLKANEKEVRIWRSKLFEVFVKSILLKRFPKDDVILDKKLPNGRNPDAAIKSNNKWINFEVTILSSSDDDYNAYDQYNKALKNNPNEVLIRPGKFDAPNSKSPSLKYDEFRTFGKVYDKITNDKLNIDKSQMAPNEPNILLISIGDAASVLDDSPGIGWAFDELFASQPKGKDNSLIEWIESAIKHLNHTNEWYIENFNKVIFAPRRLSGVIIFNGCDSKIIESRVNYNAGLQYKISHKEMADIEEIFKERPSYLSDK
jgi:hypothetical protein